MLVNFGFCKEATTYSIGNAIVGITKTTLHICSSQNGLGRCMSGIAATLMASIEIADRTTVAYYQILESPIITENLLQQTVITTTRIIIEPLIGTHHFTDVSFLNSSLESRHISFPKVTGSDIGKIRRMTSVFRTAMHGIVLGTSPELTVFGILGTLQATNDCYSHATCKIGILSISFLPTAPSRVAEDIHVRCPHRKTVKLLIYTSLVHTMMVLRTHFRRGSIKHFI